MYFIRVILFLSLALHGARVAASCCNTSPEPDCKSMFPLLTDPLKCCPDNKTWSCLSAKSATYDSCPSGSYNSNSDKMTSLDCTNVDGPGDGITITLGTAPPTVDTNGDGPDIGVVPIPATFTPIPGTTGGGGPTCCDTSPAPDCQTLFPGPRTGGPKCCPDDKTWSCSFKGNFVCSGITYKADSTEMTSPVCAAPNVPFLDLKDVNSEPAWWKIIVDTYPGDDLHRCIKRSVPPTQGRGCAMKAKTCFFGFQDCPAPVTGPYPDTKCSCDGVKGVAGTWSCDSVSCP